MARAETGQSESLFDDAEEAAASAGAPLAVRMRPRTLDEVIGQRHLTGAGTPFRKLVDNDAPMSLLLWGPPGTGKTTLDALLPAVENRWVSVIGATTENPFFSVVSPLLSRSLLLTLQPLSDEDLGSLVDRAVSDARGLNGSVVLA